LVNAIKHIEQIKDLFYGERVFAQGDRKIFSYPRTKFLSEALLWFVFNNGGKSSLEARFSCYLIFALGSVQFRSKHRNFANLALIVMHR